ncbi:MAG: transcriptional regulator, HxlR family [Pseudonocardiales bacterium]|nr:transcriptional regulator, HxlR family [Pseudonocardiales bacterium]
MKEEPCSIARSLEVLGERWTFLILRDALGGSTRFSEFKDSLKVAPDVLTDRLNTLVEAGVMTKEPYREPGHRTRYSYHLTEAGQDLRVVVGALQQGGDEHRPYSLGATILRRTADGSPVRVAFVDDRHREIDGGEVQFVRTASYPATI